MIEDMAGPALMELCDEKDAEGGIAVLASKRYSITRLRDFGYSDEEIENLLAIKF